MGWYRLLAKITDWGKIRKTQKLFLISSLPNSGAIKNQSMHLALKSVWHDSWYAP